MCQNPLGLSIGGQTQGLHHALDRLHTAVTVDGAQDGLDSGCHGGGRDGAAARGVVIDEGIEAVLSADRVEIGVGADVGEHLLPSPCGDALVPQAHESGRGGD